MQVLVWVVSLCLHHTGHTLIIMAEPLKFGATLNSGYFRFLSIFHSGEALELLFLAELKTNCLSLNMVYEMYLSCNFE